MATQAQIDANRLNAQKSTGPKTPEGRAAARLNGIKHGLTAQTLVLPGESQADFTSLLDSYQDEHQPTTPTEEGIVAQLAMATWRLRRLYHVEAGFYAYKLKMLSDTGNRHKLDDFGRLGMVADCSNDTLVTLNRQEARLERSFYKGLQELQRLRAQRPSDVEKRSQSAVPPPDPPSPSVSAGASTPTSEPRTHSPGKVVSTPVNVEAADLPATPPLAADL